MEYFAKAYVYASKYIHKYLHANQLSFNCNKDITNWQILPVCNAWQNNQMIGSTNFCRLPQPLAEWNMVVDKNDA
jgi:hypothetical protein